MDYPNLIFKRKQKLNYTFFTCGTSIIELHSLFWSWSWLRLRLRWFNCGRFTNIACSIFCITIFMFMIMFFILFSFLWMSKTMLTILIVFRGTFAKCNWFFINTTTCKKFLILLFQVNFRNAVYKLITYIWTFSYSCVHCRPCPPANPLSYHFLVSSNVILRLVVPLININSLKKIYICAFI